MRYLAFLILGIMAAALVYFSPIFLLAPSPILGEYWTREMIVIKRDISRQIGSKNKLIIASGSSTLFSIDTNILTKEFNIPAVNFGLVVSLPIETLFYEIDRASNGGDIVILPLEPDFYCKEEIDGYREWEIRNGIAWNRAYWDGLGLLEKLSFIKYISPTFPMDVVKAKYAQWADPASIAPRLNALNDDFVLAKFNSPQPPDENIYSIYNMDRLGNIKNTDESLYTGPPRRADLEIRICDSTFSKLKEFVARMTAKDVRVYFANTPFVSIEGLDHDKINLTSDAFDKKLSTIAPVIDSKSELIFSRNLFLNTELHLNATGRSIRTRRLIDAMNRNHIFPEIQQ